MSRMGRLSLLLPAALASVASAEDACECLNWKQVYESKRVLCGEGWEFQQRGVSYEHAFWARHHMGFTWHEFCGGFYHVMDNNLCPNDYMDTYGSEQRQWCYVSKDCKELNGGWKVEDKWSIAEWAGNPPWVWFLWGQATWNFYNQVMHKAEVIPRDLAVKYCKSGQDKLMNEMPIIDVLNLGASMDSVIGYVTKIAYPMARKNHLREPVWDDVKDAYEKGDYDKLPEPLRSAVKDEKPIVVDLDREGHEGQRIIKGKEIYAMEANCDASGCGAAQWPFRKVRDKGEL